MRYALLPALAMFACRLWSQALSGTIVGTVTDEAGAVVPKAKVTLTNQGTHFARVEETNSSGQFVAYSVPTGAYSIAVEMQGFSRMVREGIELTAADTVSVDFKLAVGNVQQTIEVQASAPLLQSQTAVVSQLISNQQIEEMPLNGSTFTALLLLSPGTYTGSSGNLETSPYGMRGSANYSVNGSSPQNNSYLIDGMVNRNLWLSTLIMVPTIDSIQEFRVLTSNYSAEYGAAAGAVTVVQTKSGTNQWRGSGYEFLRNDKLDANKFFNNRLGVARQPCRRNEFGATGGANTSATVARSHSLPDQDLHLSIYCAPYRNGVDHHGTSGLTWSTLTTLVTRIMVSNAPWCPYLCGEFSSFFLSHSGSLGSILAGSGP